MEPVKDPVSAEEGKMPQSRSPTIKPALLTIRSLTARAFLVPLKFALGTSAAEIRAVPLLLADVDTDEGVTGRAYTFCYTAAGARAIAELAAEAIGLVAGHAMSPQDMAKRLARRYALLGVAGPVRMALSLIDMAVWDALAKSAGLPLARLLGGELRPIAAYDSRGLGLMEPAQLANETTALLDKGLKAVKLRLGYPSLDGDLAALAAVRERTPENMPIMVDYNQALSAAEAIRRGGALEAEGITWLEEPIRHDDYRGNAAVASALRVPLQIGENFNGPEAVLEALAARACDYIMPDVCRIGGVTGWMQAAGIAAAASVEMSTHLMPEISAHLLCASPTAHWLEYVDWADAVLEEPLRLVDGAAVPHDRPGTGISWDEGKLKRLENL